VSDAKWAAIKDEFAVYEGYKDREADPHGFANKREQVEYCWWFYDHYLRPQGQFIRKGRTRYPE
jgi:hypothetical protein